MTLYIRFILLFSLLCISLTFHNKKLEIYIYLIRSDQISCSVVSNSVTPWTVARQAPLSMRLCRQKYWSGLPCTPPGNLPNPGIKPRSPAMAGDSFNTEPPGKPCNKHPYCHPKSRRPGQMMQRASTLGSFHLTSRSLICAM